MRRVLVVIDKYGWSYEAIARGLVRHNADPTLQLEIASAREDSQRIEREHARYDLVFMLGWTSLLSKRKKDGFAELMPYLQPQRVLTGIHSHRAWDDYASTPEHSPAPPAELVERLARLRGVNVISRRLHRIFRAAGLGNAMLTENGVDTRLFVPMQLPGVDPAAPLVVGFSGSVGIEKHDRLKGYSEFIEPLGRLPNVVVRALGGRGAGQVPHAQMPALYNTIDVYVCASASEGFSQSVLEAAACGRAVISSRVGGCEDLITDGVNGALVDRSPEAFAAALRPLVADRMRMRQLGAAAREVVEQRYAWSQRVQDWLRFIRDRLDAPAH